MKALNSYKQSREDVGCTLQQSMYVSTWLSAFVRMKLGGTAEVYYTLVLSDDRARVLFF